MAPTIGDQEFKEFKAQWAMMGSKEDYHVLIAKMEKRALDLHIQLPKLREP